MKEFLFICLTLTGLTSFAQTQAALDKPVIEVDAKGQKTFIYKFWPHPELHKQGWIALTGNRSQGFKTLYRITPKGDTLVRELLKIRQPTQSTDTGIVAFRYVPLIKAP
jgi:hypothetical protein